MEQQIRAAIAGSITGFHMPRFEDIPGVGLYLEQTVNCINEYLAPIQDGPITSSMVSNYVKKKLVSNPVHKQYSREQIAALFFIAVTKSVLSLDNIRVLLAIQSARYELSEAYNHFCNELERIIGYVFGLGDPSGTQQSLDYPGNQPSGDERIPEELSSDECSSEELQEIEEKNILHNTVIAVAHKIYLDKWIREYS